ncbi:MAG: hypothetical protein PHW69_02685 [Elusimicrobiaceae bacterium]|nr:hypothetical protein [Elusimicrobiaceae bacterium]
MKIKLLTLFALLLAAPAHAADAVAAADADQTAYSTAATIGPAGIDLSSVFSKLRGGTLYTFVPEGMTMGTLYAPAVSLRDSAGLELLNINAGAAINTEDGKGSPLLSLGLRADGLLKKCTAGEWAKAHVTTATLPPIELAAAGMWYAPRHIWTFGVNLAVRFSE